MLELYRADPAEFDAGLGDRVADALAGGDVVISQHVSGSMWLVYGRTIVRQSPYDSWATDGAPWPLSGELAGTSCGLWDTGDGQEVGIHGSRPIVVHRLPLRDAADQVDTLRARWRSHLEALGPAREWVWVCPADHPPQLCGPSAHCPLRRKNKGTPD